ncbi:hypothetical protein GCM10022227_51380 [Streptomyces sedi]
MSRIPGLMARVTTAVTRPAVVTRYLSGVEGVQHIPVDGPFVLVPNHSSFSDHLILDAVLHALRDTPSSYLTKSEAFDNTLRAQWTVGMGGIPVDRDQPGRDLLAKVDGVLNGGGALVIYPEGTRGTGWPLLPFKDGAFRFADRARVPVIPVALWGAQHILPKGANLPRSAKARVVFGAPLTADLSLPRKQRIADFTERTRSALETLVLTAAQPRSERDAEATAALAARATAMIERSLSRTDSQTPDRRRDQASLLLRLGRLTDPDNPDLRVTRARLAGLRALDASPPRRLALLRGVRREAEDVLRDHPDHLMARYLLGRWHLLTPRQLGGRPERALGHLREAARRGAADTRYPMAYAEALITTGQHAEASGVLRRVIDAPAPDRRTADRRQRAQARYSELTATHAAVLSPGR